MKKMRLLAGMVLSACLWAGCEHKAPVAAETGEPGSLAPKAAQPAPTSSKWPKNAVKGDFDGDGRPEYVWLVPPAGVNADEMECQGECTSYLRFSNPRLPAISKVNCIGGAPTNLGDLNGDGGDEIGLLPEWFSSCWTNYFVYTCRADKWAELVKSFPTHCNQWEAEVKPIEKDPAKPGSVLIRYSESADTAIVLRTRSVAVH